MAGSLVAESLVFWPIALVVGVLVVGGLVVVVATLVITVIRELSAMLDEYRIPPAGWDTHERHKGV